MRSLLRRPADSSGVRLLLVVIGIGLLGLLYYVQARLFGDLPSPSIWFAKGIDHGPWHDDARGWIFSLLIFGLAISAPFTVTWAFRAAAFRANREDLPLAIAAAVANIGLLVTYLQLIYWTID